MVDIKSELTAAAAAVEGVANAARADIGVVEAKAAAEVSWVRINGKRVAIAFALGVVATLAARYFL